MSSFRKMSISNSSGERPSGWQILYAGWLLGMSVPLVIGQILAFFHLFTPTRTLLLTGLALPWMAWLYAREGFPHLAKMQDQRRMFTVLWGALGCWVVLLVIFPVLFWPRTRLGVFLPWDLVYYHLPKAADLIQQRSMWNLALPYGQYPLGWENLLALSMGWSGNAEGVGPATALALAGLLLGASLLWKRESPWPMAFIGGVVAFMFFSFYIPLPNNPWRVFGLVLAESMGKNDLFAASLVLSGLYHLPLTRRPPFRFHIAGYTLSLVSALATKPNAGLALLALLAWSWKVEPRVRTALRRHGIVLLLSTVPGVLWLLRNLVILGRPFSPVVDILQKRSVLFSITQSAFWSPLPKTFLLTMGLLLLLTLWSGFQPIWRRPVGGAWILMVLFWVTPAAVTATGRIDWRFGLAFLLWLWMLVLVQGTEMLSAAWRGAWRRPVIVLLLLGAHVGGGLWMVGRYAHFLTWAPQYGHILYDPFPEPPGTGEYRSVFHFLHREIRNAVIEADGMPFFYLYGPHWTNRPVRPGFYPAGMAQKVPQPIPDHWLFCTVEWNWQRRAYPKDGSEVQETAERWRSMGYQILYQDPACILARAPSSEG